MRILRAAADKLTDDKRSGSSQAKSYRTYELLPPAQEGQKAWTDWSTEKAVQDGYKASGYVYAAIRRIAQAASSVPWIAVTKDDAGETVHESDHPLEQLIEHPNRYMSRQDIIERMTTLLYLSGNALLSKIRARTDTPDGRRKIPVELWPLMPDHIKPVKSKTDFIAYYSYEDGGQRKRLPPEDVIHVLFVNPADPYWGIGPLQAAAKPVDTDVQAKTWNKLSMQNRAVMDGVLSFNHDITPEQYQLAKDRVRQQRQNGEKVMVLGNEAQWHQMSISPAEMDFIEGQKLTRQEIAAVFDVPLPMIQIYDDATLANIETARRIFWIDTILPLLETLRSTFNRTLTPELSSNVRIEFDVSNVEALQKDFDAKVSTGQKLWQMGVPFNEVNQRLELGFDEIPGGDTGYISSTLLPADLDVEGELAKPGEAGVAPPLAKSWNLSGKEGRKRYWKSFERRRTAWYGQAARKFRELLEEEAEGIAEAYREDGEIDAIRDYLADRQEKWQDTIYDIYNAVVQEFGEATYDDLDKGLNVPGQKQDIITSETRRWMREWSLEKSDLIVDHSMDEARGVLERGIDEGRNTDEIAGDLRQYLDDGSQARGIRIARTEVVSASNYGSLQGARATGLDPKKEWVSSADDRVRDDHKTLDGTVVGQDEKFVIGYDELEYPGDPNAPSEQVVLCRCTLAYRT